MKFSVAQRFDLAASDVVAAFRREHTWRSFAGLPFVGDPQIELFEAGDPAVVATSYKVSIDLPPLADKFIEPDKLTFVERSTLHAHGGGAFEIVPDHYAKMLQSSGTSRVVSLGEESSERLLEGVVRVNLGWAGKLFEGPVEDAIVTGLKRALVAQASQLQTL